jgi:hypothetical protein
MAVGGAAVSVGNIGDKLGIRNEPKAAEQQRAPRMERLEALLRGGQMISDNATRLILGCAVFFRG